MSAIDYKVSVPECESGAWKISRFTVSEEQARFENLRASTGSGRHILPGTYTSLKRNGSIVMSDTPAEVRDFTGFTWRASGKVLVAGLGLGVVLQALINNPKVLHVTVVEKSQDVIKLVADHYRKMSPKVEIVCADIFEYKPVKGARYDYAWFDIWDNICADNLENMTRLKRKFGKSCEKKMCWCEYQCRHNRWS